MKIKGDLHIHSALSPCGDLEMSPSSIVKKALEIKLNLISVTDHNSVHNSISTGTLAKRMGLHFIYGIEVQTEEEVHILCYFEKKEEVENFYQEFYQFLPNTPNNPDFFGDQVVVDHDDNILRFEEKLLMNSVSLSIPQLVKLTNKHNGFIVPAHIESDSFGLMYNLGFLPMELKNNLLEVSYNASLEKTTQTHPGLNDKRFISNSDAHYLRDIGRAYTEYDINSYDINSLFSCKKIKIIRR